MVRAFAMLLGFVLLGLAEFACFQLLRGLGIPMGLAAVVTTTFCVGTFCLFVGLFLMRGDSGYDPRVERARYDRSSPSGGTSSSSAERLAAVPVGRGTIAAYSDQQQLLLLPETTHVSPEYAPPPSGDRHRSISYDPFPAPQIDAQSYQPTPAMNGGWDAPVGDAYAPQLVQHAPEEVEAPYIPPPAPLALDPQIEELKLSLEEQHKSFLGLVAQAQKELSRFDVHVLKSLERNQPGSVEGVLIARKILSAIETRVKDIERVLAAKHFDVGRGHQLLVTDLEIPDDKLTSLFKTKHIEPIKIAEVEFHLKVLLKRIGRRRSIFRGPMIDVGQIS